uniref:Uncharacterized protein n=1 Tax=Anguilla anguilla TaxID=7936 RepID=A0A0E9RIF2_ANGAN
MKLVRCWTLDSTYDKLNLKKLQQPSANVLKP